MHRLDIDTAYLEDVLLRLLEIPSPTGHTDAVVHAACAELDRLGVPVELTRRGAIRADFKGEQRSPDRAIAAHLDTLGAMVKGLKPNGRLEIVPIGTWSARFAEGARITVFCDGGRRHRGTILPLKASGHAYNTAIDSQPSSWPNLEVRIDAAAANSADLAGLGFHVGDIVAIDPNPEVTESGFIWPRPYRNGPRRRFSHPKFLAGQTADAPYGIRTPVAPGKENTSL